MIDPCQASYAMLLAPRAAGGLAGRVESERLYGAANVRALRFVRIAGVCVTRRSDCPWRCHDVDYGKYMKRRPLCDGCHIDRRAGW